MAYDLNPLLPFLKPCKHIDTTDTHYLKQTHTPLVNPLRYVLHIKVYNEKWFNKPLSTCNPPFNYKNVTLQIPDKQLTLY